MFCLKPLPSNKPAISNRKRNSFRSSTGAYVHPPPPPPAWEKSSSQKCPKEERKFCPDMSAKKNVHVPLIYHKIKTKKLGKKEENSERKGLKLKK